VHSERINVALEFTSGEDYRCFSRETSPSANIALSKETEPRKEEIWRKVAEEPVRKYGTDDGYVRMDIGSISVIGTEP
jgi:hypothetical protein